MHLRFSFGVPGISATPFWSPIFFFSLGSPKVFIGCISGFVRCTKKYCNCYQAQLHFSLGASKIFVRLVASEEKKNAIAFRRVYIFLWAHLRYTLVALLFSLGAPKVVIFWCAVAFPFKTTMRCREIYGLSCLSCHYK